MRQFWVVGGEYTDTSFAAIVGGGAEEWAGPFDAYEAAEAEWSRLSWRAVDNCHARYRVVERASEAWRGDRYWVVGGEYTDTTFRDVAGGGREEWFGPFDAYEAAEAEWSRLAAESAHVCHARYRVVRAEGPPPEAESTATGAGQAPATADGRGPAHRGPGGG